MIFLLWGSNSLFLTWLNILIFIIISSSLPATEVYFTNPNTKISSTTSFQGSHTFCSTVQLLMRVRMYISLFPPLPEWSFEVGIFRGLGFLGGEGEGGIVCVVLVFFPNTKCNLFTAHLKNTQSLSVLHRSWIQRSRYFMLGVCLLASLFYSKSPALY